MTVTRTTRSRHSLAGLAALVAAVLLIAGCGGDSTDTAPTTETVATTAPEPTTPTTTTAAEPTTTPDGAKTITIVLKNAAPEDGIKRATVAKGDSVNLVIHSDVEDEVHLHGYNFSADVAAGGTATINFVANVPGRFEVELEQRGVKIADLTVTP
jgi:ABC-type glycerol-3-phosphate transport system substrate-binding protein